MCRILIVDDSRTMRSVIERALTLAGFDQHDIGQASDGVEALAALEAMHDGLPELVISDVNMPRMSGTELLTAMQQRYGQGTPPTVMVTSVSSSRTLLELVRLGAARVIRKPFSPNDLPRELGPYLPPLAKVAAPVAPVQEEPEPLPPGPDSGATEETMSAALQSATAAFLERMAYAVATPVAAFFPPSRVVYTAEIALTGGPKLRLATTRIGAVALAESLSAAAPGDDDRACLDAVAEAANVIVGEFLRELAIRGVDTDDLDFGLPQGDVLVPGSYEPLHAHAVELVPGEVLSVEWAL